MLRVAIYGKGGIGKSTIVANLACALADAGLRVMQIGCDPKADSTYLTMRGEHIPSVLERMREGRSFSLDDIVFRGYADIACVESGGPEPGVGCAGRGIIAAFEKLGALDALATIQPDVVLYDVLGDVVCGGFAMPIRKGYADSVLVVTSGEMMSLYAADKIAAAVRRFGTRGYASFGGLIANGRNVEGETGNIEQLARDLESRVVGSVPRDPVVQQAEARALTVVEAYPESEFAQAIRTLAREVLALDEALSAVPPAHVATAATTEIAASTETATPAALAAPTDTATLSLKGCA